MNKRWLLLTILLVLHSASSLTPWARVPAARGPAGGDAFSAISQRVPVNSAGARANGLSDRPAVSADGWGVAFEGAGASNLVAGDTNGSWDVFIHDGDPDDDGVFDGADNSLSNRKSKIITHRVNAANQDNNNVWVIEDPTPGKVTNGLIVYVGRDANGQEQIFTIMPDGTNKRQLTHTTGGNFFPVWSHDGKKIAFTSVRTGAPELWVMDAGGSHQRQLTAPPASGNFVPSWSPRGTRIAFTSIRTGHPEIWVMNANGTNQRQLTMTVTPGGSNAPSWLPNGAKIAFASDGSGTTQAYTMNPDGSNVQQLTTPSEPNFPDSNVPVWSPDGSKIAFWSGIERQYGQVWVMGADGSNRRPLTNCPPPANCDNPAWSPDGRLILFETNRGGPVETWIMNADGSNQRRLFPFPYGAGRLPWQPVREPLMTSGNGLSACADNLSGPAGADVSKAQVFTILSCYGRMRDLDSRTF